jgi:hypothetical protein
MGSAFPAGFSEKAGKNLGDLTRIAVRTGSFSLFKLGDLQDEGEGLLAHLTFEFVCGHLAPLRFEDNVSW